MERIREAPASDGVDVNDIPEVKPSAVDIVEPGHRDKRFGLVKKLGKDGCGY